MAASEAVVVASRGGGLSRPMRGAVDNDEESGRWLGVVEERRPRGLVASCWRW